MDGFSTEREALEGAESSCVLEAFGYVDTITARRLDEELRACARDGFDHVFVDLSHVDYVSSAGWGVLVTTIRLFRERGGDLKLVGLQPDVQDVFELLQFSSILESHPDLESALAAAPTP